MPHSSQVSEPWHSFLGELDQQATEETPLDCMGGFVVTIFYGLPRATSDLDVLLIAPREQRAAPLELGVRGGALQEEVPGLPGLRGGSQGAGGLRRPAHRKCSRAPTSACGSALSILTTWRYQSSNVTSSGTAVT